MKAAKRALKKDMECLDEAVMKKLIDESSRIRLDELFEEPEGTDGKNTGNANEPDNAADAGEAAPV